jgi:hypothetical protein
MNRPNDARKHQNGTFQSDTHAPDMHSMMVQQYCAKPTGLRFRHESANLRGDDV